MNVDAHVHFWQYDPQKYSWVPEEIRRDFTPQHLRPLLWKNNIDGCMAIQADQSEEETVKLLELANSHSFIKGVVGWIDLSAEDAEERLELYSRNPAFKGVRHTVWDEKGEFMVDSAFQRGITALGKFGLTFDILAFEYQLGNAVDLVKAFPNQAFVLDHIGKPKVNKGVSDEWLKHIKEIGTGENVYCKLSGMVTEAENVNWKASDIYPFLEEVTAAFGTDRLMFGSDWPVCMSVASYREVFRLVKHFYRDFSDEEKEKVFGANATRFYNLG